MQLCGRIFKKMPPTPFCPHPAPKSLYKGEPLLECIIISKPPFPQIQMAHRRQEVLRKKGITHILDHRSFEFHFNQVKVAQNKNHLFWKFCSPQSWGCSESKSFIGLILVDSVRGCKSIGAITVKFPILGQCSSHPPIPDITRPSRCPHNFQMSLTVTQNCPFMSKLLLNIDAISKPFSWHYQK